MCRAASSRKPSTPLLHPELADLDHLLAHGRVVVVQVGHAGRKDAQVVLPPAAPARPGRRRRWRSEVGARRGPAVPVVVRVARVLRGDEPGMPVAGVVDHQVHDHLDAALVRLGQQVLEVGHAAVLRVDAVVIGDVVAVVAGRGVDRHQPDAADAERLQVVELGGDAVEVADAVAVGVVPAAHEDLVPHAGAVGGATPSSSPWPVLAARQARVRTQP